MMRSTGSPHVSPVTCVDDEGNGPPVFMCHMWMPERPPPHIKVSRTHAEVEMEGELTERGFDPTSDFYY